MSANPVRDDGKLNPTLSLESRPSAFTGISFWLVLAYRHHVFETQLPPDFFGMDDTGRDLVIAKEAGALKARLAPILDAEDRLVTSAPVPEDDVLRAEIEANESEGELN